MSIRSIYVVCCSGCGYYADYDGKRSPVQEKAALFSTWDKANKFGAHVAKWFDGHNGEYAVCTCDAEFHHHTKCRKMRPRFVPLCPPCRRDANNVQP